MISQAHQTQLGLAKFGRVVRQNWWKFAVLFAVLSFLQLGWAFTVTSCPGGSNQEEAKIQTGNIKQSLDMYYTRTDPHEYPKELDQLVDRNIMQEVLSDPWGQPYVYVRTSESDYVLFSAGPDGIAGNEDDIGRVSR